MTDQLREKLLAMRCVNCNHRNGWHSEAGDSCFQVVMNAVPATKCKCTKFVPSDNLTWIEYLSEKRGLI